MERRLATIETLGEPSTARIRCTLDLKHFVRKSLDASRNDDCDYLSEDEKFSGGGSDCVSWKTMRDLSKIDLPYIAIVREP